MITTAILTVIWGIVKPLLVRIPDLQINYAGLSSMSVYQYLRAGLYFFPMGYWSVGASYHDCYSS